MEISCFDDLLQAARNQAQPQRLLFVFVATELPAGATAEQVAHFHAGHGGALVPAMCVDRSPQELESFETLTTEASQFGQLWNMVFAAALSGTVGQSPATAEIDLALERMVESIKRGELAAYIPFDRQGNTVSIS